MSQQVTEAFVQQFNTNVMHLSQQKGSRLADKVRKESQKSKAQFFDRIGLTAAVKRTGRHAATPQMDTPHSRRMVTMEDYEWSDLVDDQDKIRMLIDPTSSIVQAQAAQMNRKVDDIIIASLYADMKTGKTGSGTSALTETVNINSWAYGTGSGNSNLTISKLIEAAGILDENDVAMEDRYIVMDPVNHSKLLATAEATSSDFITSRSLETGKVDGLVGFKFIKSTRLPTDGSGYRRCFAWHKSGMALGIAKNPTFDISQRKDKRGQPWQAYLSLSMAGTRLENDKVVEIKCLAS